MNLYNDRRKPGKVLFGLVIILIGLVMFLRQIDVLPNINMQFTWPLILIIVGLFIGIRNKFSSNAPFILMAVGVFNLIPAFSFTVGNTEVDSEDLVVPAILIIAGLVMVLKPRKKKPWNIPVGAYAVSDMTLSADIVFGGRKEIVTSKEFKGGRITATFGGAEINLMQADTPDKEIVLDVRATFGGVEIIVSSDWDIKNEIVPILGSVEDLRTMRFIPNASAKKTLILQGSVFCGGIEIKSY